MNKEYITWKSTMIEWEYKMYFKALNFVEVRCSICHTIWIVDDERARNPYICPLCREEKLEDNDGVH